MSTSIAFGIRRKAAPQSDTPLQVDVPRYLEFAHASHKVGRKGRRIIGITPTQLINSAFDHVDVTIQRSDCPCRHSRPTMLTFDPVRRTLARSVASPPSPSSTRLITGSRSLR